MAQPISRAASISLGTCVAAVVVSAIDRSSHPVATADPFEQGALEGHAFVVILLTVAGVILAVVGWRAIRKGAASGLFVAVAGFVFNLVLLIIGVVRLMAIESSIK